MVGLSAALLVARLVLLVDSARSEEPSGTQLSPPRIATVETSSGTETVQPTNDDSVSEAQEPASADGSSIASEPPTDHRAP